MRISDIKDLDDIALEEQLEHHRKAIETINAEIERRKKEALSCAWDDVVNSIKYYLSIADGTICIHSPNSRLYLDRGFVDEGIGYLYNPDGD